MLATRKYSATQPTVLNTGAPKAIVIAAGQGSRLGELTRDCPKCLLPISGNNTILDYQLCAFGANGISDVALVKGFCAEKLADRNLRSYLNTDFKNNNILCSLMYAADEFNDALVVSYSDILYTPAVVKALLESPHDIAAVVDVDWKERYVGRTEHPESEAEKTLLAGDNRALEFGKIIHKNPSEAARVGEFIGLFKLSAKGAETFKFAFAAARKEFAGKPFFTAPVFEKAYITDMLNYLISKDIPVHGVPIEKNWLEIDTMQDLEYARQWVKTAFKEEAR